VTRTASRAATLPWVDLDPERREEAVEAAVLEGEILGVALQPGDLDDGRGGALAGAGRRDRA
jgi:hypothetical protein